MSEQTSIPTRDVPHFELPDWFDKISVIDSDDQLDDLYQTLKICAEKHSPIGLDTETCLLLSDGASSIIQLSTPSEGFIIDSFRMTSSSRLASLILWIMQNAKLRKYTYAFPNDIKAMRRNFPEWPETLNSQELYDLYQFSAKGLSNLFNDIYNVPLGWSEETMSLWTRRPLRNRQICYAIIDALAPMLIREALKNRGIWTEETKQRCLLQV